MNYVEFIIEMSQGQIQGEISYVLELVSNLIKLDDESRQK